MLSVGIGAAPTVSGAEAVPPGPPSFEVTALVVLFFTPALVPVTFTLKEHIAPPASVAADRLMLPLPAVAVIVPPPQEPVSPFGVATTSPLGKASLNPTPVSAVDAFRIGDREGQAGGAAERDGGRSKTLADRRRRHHRDGVRSLMM